MYKEICKSMGNKIVEARKAFGYNPTEAASKIGVNYVTYRKYESGEILEPTVDVLYKIADFYCLSIDYLLGRCDGDAYYTMNVTDIVMDSYERYVREKREGRGPNKLIFDDPLKAIVAPWPYNLLEEVFGERFALIPVPLNDEQISYIFDVLDNQLKPRESGCIRGYYELEKTLNGLGEEYNVGKERIRQIIAKGIRKLRNRAMLGEIDRWAYPKDYQEWIDARETKKRLLADITQEENAIDILKKAIASPDFECDEAEKFVSIKESPLSLFDLADQGLSVRTFNALGRTFDGYYLYDPDKRTRIKDHPYAKIGRRNATIDDIYKLYMSGDIKKVRNLGKKSIEELTSILKANGYSIETKEDANA